MQEVKTIHEHYARQATPEIWAELDDLRERVARPKSPPLTEQEHYYLHSILRCLRDLDRRVCEEWQGVSLQSEALGENIDWLDCFIEARCPTRGKCDQCWPEESVA
jgi:hypothetical protein